MQTRIITTGQIARCPVRSLLPSHFRDNGTCFHFAEDGSGPISRAGQDALVAHRQAATMRHRAEMAAQREKGAVGRLSEPEREVFEKLAAEADAAGGGR